MNVKKEIQRFKMELLRKMPFYGDILMHLVFVESFMIPTASTNGKTIWYNPTFLSGLSDGERNFVLMHEFFHVILRHGARNANMKRDKEIWNVACDVIVNSMLLKLQWDLRKEKISFEKPSFGLFAEISENEKAKNLNEKIK